MLLQTNSYIVPKERRAEHARVIRRFRQALARIGCDQFEVYEQVGSNWSPGGANGRYVQIMRFRDRQHQQAVQTAERADPGAQQIISEFCELINFPYQHQHGYFATGFYTSVIPTGPRQAVEYQGEDGGGDDGNSAAQSGATEEIDATEFESTPVTGEAGEVEKQTTGQAEPEADIDIDLDDGPETPQNPSAAEISSESAENSVVSEPAAELVLSQEVNADLLGQGDLRLEPEVVASDIASTAQVTHPHFGSPEVGLLEPAIPLSSAIVLEAAPVELPAENAPLPVSETVEATDPSDESPAAAEPVEPLPQTPNPVLAEPSPEANLFAPESVAVWETAAGSQPLVIEPAAPDQSHPSDAGSPESTEHFEPESNNFDPIDSGLIFDEESVSQSASAGSHESVEHAFAFDEPQLKEPASSMDASFNIFPPAGAHHEASSLDFAQDDLMPAALESHGSNLSPLAAEPAFSEHAVDALLDDAHLIDHVALPGAAEPAPKVHSAEAPASSHGIDAAAEKDAELLDFEAMIRDLQDPSAEHGRRAH